MSTLHVWLPPLTRFAESAPLARWLARGDRLPDVAAVDARGSALRGLFHFAGDSIPSAALRHHAASEHAEPGAWLAADPAYVRSEPTGARLMAWPIDDLVADEATQLASAVRPLCGDAGAPLVVDAPAAWCLQLDEVMPLAEFTSPIDALGVDLLECLPRGDAGRAWRRLFNEAQVALHAHPVNVARVAAGKVPVNALWFWGAGSLPAAAETRLARVASHDGVLRGLAKVAGVACVEPSETALDDPAPHGDALLDLDTTTPLGDIGPWLAYFQRCLRTQRFDVIAPVFASGESFRVRHAHRLRFWRHG